MIKKQSRNKIVAKLLSAFFLTNVAFGGIPGNVLKVKAESETSMFKFDFGDGVVKDGYAQVKSTSQYSESSGFGFSDLSKVTAGSTTEVDAVKGDYLISNGTTFNVDLEPGDYRVNVILGDTASATIVDVGAERKFGKDVNGIDTYLLNMMKLSAVQASAGEFLEKSFTISLIDNQLNLDFIGDTAKISGLEIYKLPQRTAGVVPTVYITSDSTVQTYDSYWKPQAGWGQMLSRFFSEGVNIDNRAIGGRSSRSFVSEGRLDVILNEIKPGDYIFVQWGHNDATNTRPERYVSDADFPTYIKMYIDGARQRGAIPVLITPVARRSIDAATGLFNISFDKYRQKMMYMAESEKTALIDLGLKSKNFLDAFGVEGSTSIFLHVPAGVYGAFPNGSTDDTHYQEFGAIQMAKLVSEGVKEANLPIAQFLKNIEPPAAVTAAPQNLTTGKIGSSNIAMSWSTVEGADIYYIYRQKVGDTEFKKAGTSTVTQFTDVNAAQETSYNYYVVAVNGKGESLPSNTVTATTKAPGFRFDFGIVGSPVQEGFTGLTHQSLYNEEKGYGFTTGVSAGRDRGATTTHNDLQRDFVLGKAEFKLDVPNGDYSVKITVGDSSGTAKCVLSAEGKALGTVTGGLVEKLTEVRVLDGQLNIGYDGWLNGIEVTAILLAPTGLRSYEKILGEVPSVVLAWNPVEDAGSYNVYRKSDTDADFIKIANVKSTEETKYYEQSVNLGSSYDYKVTALTSDGYESAATNIENVVMIDPTAAIPNPPTGLTTLNLTKNSATVKWDTVQGAVLYNIYRSKDENGTYSKVGSTKDLQFTDNAVTTNINYFYKIQAVSAGGPSVLSQALKTDVTLSLSRQTENLTDRALIAMKSGDGVYLSWRSLKNDSRDMTFNVFRDGKQINLAPITNSTNYVDPTGTLTSTYYVVPVVKGTAQAQSKTVKVLENNYFDIKIDRPVSGLTPLNEEYTYDANDASVADLDGDGEYEIVVKWSTNRSKDNSQGGYTGEPILDAYEMDGTKIWRINLGKNIRSGAHYNPFMVYDFDGDGKAEVVVKTADGTVDGTGKVIGDATVDYRNPSGYIITGPEFLTVFNGQTGAEIDTVNYEPERGRVDDWGDSWGNRVDRFLACVAYLNGETPSVIMARGYYTRAVLVAYDFVGGKLVERWTIDSNDAKNAALYGEGNHNLAVGDVDGDQMDEIIYGGAAIDNDGSLLYSTELGHGDANHMSDLDPTRPGLEYYQVHEHYPSEAGMEMRDPKTGELLWGVPKNYDVGRGVAADVDPRYLGAEAWAIGNGEVDTKKGGIYTVKGQLLSEDIPSANFSIYWDGDLLRELADHNWDKVNSKGVGKIDKWNYENNTLENLLTATGTNSNNSTKGNPCLQADLFGDWREEIIWRTEDNNALRVYSTTIPTDYKFTTLMQDEVYRLSVAWQNTGYNQPPQVGFYLGDNSTPVELKVTETGSRSVTLDWSDVLAGAQSYNIYRSNTVDGEFVKVGSATESTYKDTTNEPEKEYFYKVTSVTDGKESYASLKVNTKTPFGIVGIKPLTQLELVKDAATIDLPTKIVAIGSDGTEVTVDVTWDASKIDIATIGTYTATGTVLGYDGKVELSVLVKANYVAGLKEIAPIKTVVNVNPILPTKATLVYGNKTEQETNVTWDTTGLDINKIGTYTIEGTVSEFTGKAKLTIEVVANYIASINPVAEVKVAEGKGVVLPAKVTAVYADATTAEVDVTWTTVNTARHGTYTVEGTVVGYEPKVTASVVVYDEPLFKFDMGGKSTKYGNGKVEPGYIEIDAVLKYSAGEGYGFTDGSVLTCINRDSASTNKMFTDYASTWNGFGEFKVDLPNGVYKVKVYSGDLGGSTNTTFTIEGKAFNKISSRNVVNTAEYTVTVTDGVLNVYYGQGSGMGALNGLEITPVPVDSITDTTIKVVKGINVTLPTTVKATYHDDSIKDLNVTWDNASSVDINATGLYSVEGTVAETNIKAKASVFVADIVQLADAKFAIGTEIKLPETVKAVYGTESAEVSVTWTGVEALTALGDYTLQGTVAEYNTTVSMKVSIVADYITNVKQLDNISIVEGGTPTLPTTVAVVYATGKEETLTVTWDTSKLDNKVVGTYNLEGTVVGYDGKATIVVEVKAKSIASVKDSILELIEGTEAVLPTTVTIVYDNASTGTANVVWDRSTLDMSKHGVYILKGTVEGFATQATLTVTVIDKPLYRFDFGGTGTNSGGGAIAAGPVAPGYTEVTKDSLYTTGSDYGFTEITGLNARNHGGDDPVKADFVMPYNEVKEFKANVPNGTYIVKLTSGALQSGFRTTNNVTIEGTITDAFSTNASVVVKEYEVLVSDNVLNLTIGNAGRGAAAINGLVITPMTFDSLKPMDSVTIKQDEVANLPTTGIAYVHHDGSTKQVTITWDAVDTSKVGTYTVEGTVVGYAGKATITVVVTEKDQVPVKSNDATLSGITVDGVALANFVSETTVYNVELPTGTVIVPTVAGTVTASGKANAVVTEATALPGATTIEVTAEDGTTIKTYTINFTVAKPDLKVERLVPQSGNFNLGDAAKVRIRVTNNAQESKNVALIVALFDSNNHMVVYGASQLSVEATKQAELEVMMNIPSSGSYTVKYFVWDSLDGQTIIAEPGVIPVN